MIKALVLFIFLAWFVWDSLGNWDFFSTLALIGLASLVAGVSMGFVSTPPRADPPGADRHETVRRDDPERKG